MNDAIIVSGVWLIIGFMLVGGCVVDKPAKAQEKPAAAPTARKEDAETKKHKETIQKLAELYAKRDQKPENDRLADVIEDFKDLTPGKREKITFTGILGVEKETNTFLGRVSGYYLFIPANRDEDIPAQVLHVATYDHKTDQFLHRAHLMMGPVFAPKLTVEVTVVHRAGYYCGVIEKITAIESARMPQP